eukprot:2394396-Amphidinium_carterae.1
MVMTNSDGCNPRNVLMVLMLPRLPQSDVLAVAAEDVVIAGLAADVTLLSLMSMALKLGLVLMVS